MPVQSFLFFTAGITASIICFFSVLSSRNRAEVWRRLSAILTLGPVVACVGLLSMLHARGTLEMNWLFGNEFADMGPIEYGTAIAFLAASGFSLVIFARTQGLDRALYLLLALACFFIAGEEISWGQWIFHWATPEGLAAANLQHETNLHNLVDPRLYDPIYCLVGFLLLAMAAMAEFGPSAYWIVSQAGENVITQNLNRFCDWVRSSHFGLTLTLSTGVFLQHESFEEYVELLLAMTLVLFLRHVLNGQRSRRQLGERVPGVVPA